MDLPNKQKERQQRGANYETEMAESWRRIPNCWYMKIPDGGGDSRPGDYIIMLIGANILAEYKRTDGDKFNISFLRPNQINGLINFEATDIPINNGVVFVSFLNDSKGIDEAYAFRLYPAIRFMREQGKKHIKLEEFRNGTFPALKLESNLEIVDKNILRIYDLKEVRSICK